MSEGIVITPDKIFVRYWNGEKRKYYRRIIKPKNLPFYAWEHISFEGDVSLGRIFSLIEANLKKWSVLLCENIEPFLEESHKPIEKEEDDKEPLSFLELHWDAEKTTFKQQDDFTLWPGFHGVGFATEDDPHDMYKKGDRVAYAIEFTPVNELVHLPVRLDERVNMFITDLDAFEATKDTTHREVNLGEKTFTLLEVFKGIFWELTFMGSPEHRDEEMEGMRETMDGIRDGTIETIPWEDVKDKIDKKINEQKDLTDLLDEGI